jgi:hypothetical protein
LSGSVEIFRGSSDKPERLALFEGGQVFGEMSLVSEKPRSVTARAVTDTRLEVVSRGGFEEMILRRPGESLKYLRALFEKIRSLNARVEGAPAAELGTSTGRGVAMNLIPLTDAARSAVPGGGLTLTAFPFRIGRASEDGKSFLQVNDLSLPDSSPHFVSRNHLSLDVEDGRPLVRDRGSFLGTIVNGTTIGGEHRGAVCELREGENEVVVGTKGSPFRFRVVVSSRK